MPSAFHMPPRPLFNRLDVLLCVLNLVSDLLLVARQDLALRTSLRIRKVDTPATMTNARAEVTRQGIGVGRGKVHVPGSSGAIVAEERMHGGHLARIGIHAARRLARLDVAPHHGRHVALVVHEARVEVGHLVRVGRLDVREAAAEGVLEEVEHCEEVARRHQHVVAEPARDDRVVHHRLVRLVLEVRVPSGLELRGWPGLHVFELLVGRTDLDAGVDAVGGEGPGAFEVPFIEDALNELALFSEINDDTYAFALLGCHARTRQNFQSLVWPDKRRR
jgi:hypothetical protein